VNYTRGGLSLLTGWLPLTLEIVAAVVLLVVVLRSTRRWYLLWLPLAALVGAGVALAIRYEVSADGLTNDPAPVALWIWTGLTAAAVVVVVVGWRGSRWWRRALSVLAVPLALLCVASNLNQWVGYFPTVQEAWGAVTAGPLPDQVTDAQLAAMATAPARPATGALVGVNIPSTASGFTHREEYVYLPPTWFTGTTKHPALPALMMIGGEFNTPSDWIRTGDAMSVVNSWAAAHGGSAPIMVFVDAGGAFNNDTQCVDGPRGNSADHLTGDVRPYVISRFHASAAPANWGIVGWSMGGTCAADLVVMHPELFGTFEDIAGDLGPAVGGKAQTIAQLYGGNAAAWARFDPLTVLTGHARYTDTAGWFENSTTGPGQGRYGGHPGGPPGAYAHHRTAGTGFGGQADPGSQGSNQTQEAAQLCAAMTTGGITCTQHTTPGGHTWQVASTSFSDAFPWLVSRVEGAPAAQA
jgi:S-formylglutathione hydrolase FrmB